MNAVRGSAPRKLPVQARSRLTVASILEAAAQVLMSRGYDGTTTNVVAEKAGVSIGSLYEYFPNKEALVDALARSHVEDLGCLVDDALRSCEKATPKTALLTLIHAGLQAHRINPGLHKVLVEQVPRIGALAESLDISSVLQRKIETYFHERFPALALSDVRMISFVLETCIEALTHRAIVEAPAWLQSGELEREAMKLLTPYLEQALGTSDAWSTPVTGA